MFVREFVDGQELEKVLLVRASELRSKHDGSEYLQLSLADRTGAVVAIVRDRARELAPLCEAGGCVAISGRFDVNPRYGPELVVESLRRAEPHEYDLADLVDGPPRTAAQMEAALRDLISQVQSPHLSELLARVLGPDAPSWPAYRDAPAAKRLHQAYRHGLLEHSLSVGEAVAVISTTFPGIDRDVAITGALLHDIGKLDAYTSDPLAIDLTDLGKLHGEIALGYYRIRREIEAIPGFPDELGAAVLHIILSHHGQLEHGSPVLPATREATLVHMIDNLGGKLGSFDRLEKELPHGSAWSAYDRAIGGGAYFAARQAA
jgi:3'-5' exoribonuclease